MTTLPDYEAFARAYVAGEAEVAVTTLVADLETPVSAYQPPSADWRTS